MVEAVFPAWLLPSFGLAFGLVVGSFLNVVIHRLPEGRSLAWPGSHRVSASAISGVSARGWSSDAKPAPGRPQGRLP